MKLLILIVSVMGTEALMHYIPWRKILRGRELPRLAAYTFGLLGMMVPFTVWLWDRNEIDVILVLWAVVVSAGVMVFALYGFDHYLDLIMKDIEAREREQRQRDARQS
jgi:hypothetical protein